jgi:hypothetical protein
MPVIGTQNPIRISFGPAGTGAGAGVGVGVGACSAQPPKINPITDRNIKTIKESFFIAIYSFHNMICQDLLDSFITLS